MDGAAVNTDVVVNVGEESADFGGQSEISAALETNDKQPIIQSQTANTSAELEADSVTVDLSPKPLVSGVRTASTLRQGVSHFYRDVWRFIIAFCRNQLQTQCVMMKLGCSSYDVRIVEIWRRQTQILLYYYYEQNYKFKINSISSMSKAIFSMKRLFFAS